MDAATLTLVVGMATFVGTHLLMSHPWRAGMVRLFGQGGFLGIYSLISLVAFSVSVVAFGKAPATPQLWDGQALVPWVLASLLTFVASARFLHRLSEIRRWREPILPGFRPVFRTACSRLRGIR
ncbi:NnrU family protein [Novosphingobium sp. NDB2Meth1]|uniref:NnrU family protein n=1 Tax=Novosphingobium sp. NDB2Meth1 TaxID=1892847 RepID=UPI000A934F27|nr:NnrU family protein [Novosphingobium sp. NDB2Meth1]